jgi:hypothetical protein
MQEWFYVKNDLSQREDVIGIIQRPIWSRFGIRRQPLHLGMMCKHARQLSTQCAPTLAQETWFKSTLLIECGHLKMGGKCRRRLLLALAKVV